MTRWHVETTRGSLYSGQVGSVKRPYTTERFWDNTEVVLT
jgi:hypothetical protein